MGLSYSTHFLKSRDSVIRNTLVGYESHEPAAPGVAAAPKIAVPEIYFCLLEAQRGIIPIFFSLYQLQIVLLTIVNKKILVFPK